MKKLITLFIVTLGLSSCTSGPDYTADVVTHAASYSGSQTPEFNSRGQMMGMQSTVGSANTRRTMLHD